MGYKREKNTNVFQWLGRCRFGLKINSLATYAKCLVKGREKVGMNEENNIIIKKETKSIVFEFWYFFRNHLIIGLIPVK